MVERNFEYRKLSDTRSDGIMSTSFHLNNKTILITGASSGIGRETAIKCSEMGAKIILTARNKERLELTEKKLKGSGHKLIVCDLLNEKELKDLITKCDNVDGVVHCSGVVKPFPIGFLSKEKMDETMGPNFYAVVALTNSLFKNKKVNNNASIIFMSSVSGQHPHKGGSMYAASKAAVEAFSKTVALEFYAKGIRSNCISPAMVKTEMYESAANDMTREGMEAHVAKYPLGVGHPEDVANAAIFLLSPASKWVTGINLIMDGGMLLQG